MDLITITKWLKALSSIVTVLLYAFHGVQDPHTMEAMNATLALSGGQSLLENLKK